MNITNNSIIQTNIKKNGKYRFTKDGIFAIEPEKPLDQTLLTEFQTNSIYLYIKDDYIIEDRSALFNLMKHHFIVPYDLEPNKILTMKVSGLDITNKYNTYIFYRPLKDERKYTINTSTNILEPNETDESINENDCLKFGECLTVANSTGDKIRFNSMIQQSSGPTVLQVNQFKKQFGVTDKKNIQLLKNIPDTQKNNNAIPESGDSYAIVRTSIVENSAPYHIAFVLYSHNNINITLEASADSGNIYHPRFAFYDRNPKGYTFHKHYSSYYDNGETIVLNTRFMDDVLKEVDKENSRRRKVGGSRRKKNKCISKRKSRMKKQKRIK